MRPVTGSSIDAHKSGAARGRRSVARAQDGAPENRLARHSTGGVSTAGPMAAEKVLDQLGLVGCSPAIQALRARLERVARYRSTFLVLGESGSGKELIARALHALGPCRLGPFVAVNCATLGPDSLENVLFGHEAGAFHAVPGRMRGLLEIANGGFLLLDQIDQLDLSTQAMLLRVLERKEFRRVGGTAKIRVNLSVGAASSRNLESAVLAGRFRDDLYYRIKVLTVVAPPLRERREDISALVELFIRDFNQHNDCHLEGLSSEALGALARFDWPGNVRELRNAVESAAVNAAGDTVTAGDLDPRLGSGAPHDVADAAEAAPITVPAQATLDEAARLIIVEHLRRARTKVEASRALGIGLRTLYSKIHAFNLDTPPPGAPQPG
jgi:DNA-binding NtrC family response regulator